MYLTNLTLGGQSKFNIGLLYLKIWACLIYCSSKCFDFFGVQKTLCLIINRKRQHTKKGLKTFQHVFYIQSNFIGPSPLFLRLPSKNKSLHGMALTHLPQNECVLACMLTCLCSCLLSCLHAYFLEILLACMCGPSKWNSFSMFF